MKDMQVIPEKEGLRIFYPQKGLGTRTHGASSASIHGDINNCALLISAFSASLRDKKVSRRGAEAAENVNRG
jgi:hypothetical protein